MVPHTLRRSSQLMGSVHITKKVLELCSSYADAGVPFLPQTVVPSGQQGSASASEKGKRKACNTTEDACPAKCRKERASNWTLLEILDMVAAERHEFLEDIEVEDVHELMHPKLTKWGKTAIKVNEADKVRAGDIR